MVHDWGSRDATFMRINRACWRGLPRGAGRRRIGSHVAVPMQGSGTFAVEAMLGQLRAARGQGTWCWSTAPTASASRSGSATIPRAAPSRLLDNAGGHLPPDPWPKLDIAVLAADPAISHVFAVHCETTSRHPQPDRRDRRGRRPPPGPPAADRFDERLRRAAARRRARSLRRAGRLGQQVPRGRARASASSSARGGARSPAKGNATSLALDLHDQWQAMEKTGQWRFTPPTHVIAGASTRRSRSTRPRAASPARRALRANCRTLVEGMRALGFETLLPDSCRRRSSSPSSHAGRSALRLPGFYDRLKERGYVIYPGKLTVADSFRIGCIGRLDAEHMRGALTAVREMLDEMGVRHGAPAVAA
jgi:2-aminoethylphosphonate-pyruvate transaminase